MYPMRSWMRWGSTAGSMPSTRRLPEVALRRPTTSRMSVVFPAPSGPTSATNSPPCTSIETPSSACTSAPSPGARKSLRKSCPMTTAADMSMSRAVGEQVHRSGHAEPQHVVGILHEYADLIYQTRAQLLRLYCLRREFRDGRDEAYPACEAPPRKRVDADGRRHAGPHAPEVRFRHVGAHPFRVHDGERERGLLR